MTFAWEAEAKTNKPMPAGLTLSEQLAFQALSYLTERWRRGMITTEHAQRERKLIDRCYVEAAAKEGYVEWNVGLRKRIEITHSEYRKKRTVEAADRLSDVIDGFVRV